MAMRRNLAAALILLLVLACAGCGGEEATSASEDYPPMLMVDGVLYKSTGRQVLGEVDESATETVSSYTDTEPTEDGQQNFDRSCAVEYGMTADGLMVTVDHELVRFEPVETAE